MCLIPSLIFFALRADFKNIDHEKFQLLKIMSTVTIALSPLVFISTLSLHRFNFYVLPVSILILTEIQKVYKKSIGKSSNIIALSAFGAYFVAWYFLSEHAILCYRPYQNFLL